MKLNITRIIDDSHFVATFSPGFMEPENSMLYSEQPRPNLPYPKPAESSSNPHIWRLILLLV
jgi:hypothetical protein